MLNLLHFWTFFMISIVYFSSLYILPNTISLNIVVIHIEMPPSPSEGIAFGSVDFVAILRPVPIPAPPPPPSPPAPTSSLQSALVIRKEFPETWLLDYATIDDDENRFVFTNCLQNYQFLLCHKNISNFFIASC